MVAGEEDNEDLGVVKICRSVILAVGRGQVKVHDWRSEREGEGLVTHGSVRDLDRDGEEDCRVARAPGGQAFADDVQRLYSASFGPAEPNSGALRPLARIGVVASIVR